MFINKSENVENLIHLWNSGYLNIRKMCNVYSFYLESSDVTDFRTWLERHTFFTDYQIKRLIKFCDSPKAKSICTAHAFRLRSLYE